MKGLLGIVGIMLVAGCAGVPPAAVRDWSSHNFGNYRKLVDEKFPGDGSQDTRLNSYKSMASLICTADTVGKTLVTFDSVIAEEPPSGFPVAANPAAGYTAAEVDALTEAGVVR